MLGTFENKYEPEAGKLLISEPFLFDSNFRRTVVLLTEHDAAGSVGFVLNRQLDIHLKDVLDLETIQSIPLHLGGPVQNNTLHYVHTDEQLAPSSRIIREGLYWGGDFDKIVELLESNQLDESKYRFFLGYSGWSEGQLEEELNSNSWIVAPCVESILQLDEKAMWQHILKDMGGQFKLMSQYPESPLLN